MKNNYNENEIVFGKAWFEKHQAVLLWLLNTPGIKKWFRWVMAIDCTDTINQIYPNAYTFGGRYISKDRIELKTDFRIHNKYAKRLYFAFKPMWYAMHFWDMTFANQISQQLNFGFDTLTVAPQAGAGGGNTTCDGYIQYTVGTTWSACRSAATGSTADATINQTALVTNRLLGSDWYINRSIFTIDTSALTASASISAAVFSIKGHDTATSVNTDSIDVHMTSSSPAADNTLATADFDQVGTTSFGSLALSGWHDSDNVYNDFTLNADGRSNISKTGISKFGMRGSLDLADSPTPTANNQAYGRYADYTGTGDDPKLVITYTISAATAGSLLLLGIGT